MKPVARPCQSLNYHIIHHTQKTMYNIGELHLLSHSRTPLIRRVPTSCVQLRRHTPSRTLSEWYRVGVKGSADLQWRWDEMGLPWAASLLNWPNWLKIHYYSSNADSSAKRECLLSFDPCKSPPTCKKPRFLTGFLTQSLYPWWDIIHTQKTLHLAYKIKLLKPYQTAEC